MSDSSRPPARKPSQPAKPAARSSGNAPAKPARPAKPAAPADDEFAGLASAAVPPRVVKKKKLEGKKTVVVEHRRDEPGTPAYEVLVPTLLIVVGLAMNVATSVMLAEDVASLAFWVTIRMIVVLFSAIITTVALFVAAAVLDTAYGYFSTALLKVAAIVLTQAWIGDLSSRIPFPFVDWLISFGTTYAMFKYFFELDDIEAIASMVVVRLVHWLAIAVAFIALVGFLAGRSGSDGPDDGDGFIPGVVQPGDGGADDGADEPDFDE